MSPFTESSGAAAVRRARDVEAAYATDLTVHGGFLPPLVPASALPTPLDRHFEAAASLAERYHGEGLDVRPWLDAELGDGELAREAAETVARLSPAEGDAALSVLALLAHAYRWANAPPRRDEYHRTSIALPAAIAAPFAALAAARDEIRVGSLYSMVLCNWRMRAQGRGGGTYENDEIDSEQIAVARSWLRAPQADELHHFLLTAIETEARGAIVLRTLVALVGAAAHDAVHEGTYLLDRLRSELDDLSKPFRHHVQRKKIHPDSFLTLIQPTTIWNLDEGTGHGPLEGASGPQVGSIQAVDAVLGVARRSPMGHAISKSRAYMPARHRHFLSVLDAAGGDVRSWVARRDDPRLSTLFNDCADAMLTWRRTHEKRGALYLRGESNVAEEYTSTGQVVALGTDRVTHFERSMQERAAETREAAVAVQDEASRDPLERALRELTDADRAALLEGAEARAFSPEAALLEAGARRVDLIVVREGAVRVVRMQQGAPVVVARLSGGALVGELSFLENEDTSAAVLADGPVQADAIPREHVFRLFRERPGFEARFYRSVAALVSRRLRETSATVTDLLRFQDAPAGPPRPPRAGRLGDRALPGEAVDLVSYVRAAFAEADAQAEEAGGGGKVEEPASVDLAAGRAVEVCVEAARTAQARARVDAAWAGVSDALRRAAIDALGTSVVFDLADQRPTGRSGDVAVVRHVLQGEAAGDAVVGRSIDAALLALPTCKALRAAPVVAARTLAELASDESLRVLGLGGTTVHAFAAAHRAAPDLPFDAMILERAPAVCTEAVRVLRDHQLASRVTVRHEDPARLVRRRAPAPLPPCDVVLLDHWATLFDDDALALHLAWARAALRGGGAVVAVCPAAALSDRAFWEDVAGWAMSLRTVGEWGDVLVEAGFSGAEVSCEEVGDGVVRVVARRG